MVDLLCLEFSVSWQLIKFQDPFQLLPQSPNLTLETSWFHSKDNLLCSETKNHAETTHPRLLARTEIFCLKNFRYSKLMRMISQLAVVYFAQLFSGTFSS